jgi:hypothetical protein
MSQSEIWKKRPAGVASEFKDQARTWLEPLQLSRKVAVIAADGWQKNCSEAAQVLRKITK